MAGSVYVLSALTCLVCTALLFRGYRQTGVRLLFWSSLCFLGLTLDNVALYVDALGMTNGDLDHWRRVPGMVGLVLLVFGLVWESK